MDKFKELGETLKEIKELEAKASILRKEVLGEVIANGGKVIHDLGVFIEIKTKSWVFPKYIQEAEEIASKKINVIKVKLDSLKEKSRSMGKATFTTTSSVRFDANK